MRLNAVMPFGEVAGASRELPLGMNEQVGGAWMGGTIDATGAVVAADMSHPRVFFRFMGDLGGAPRQLRS